MINEKVQSLYNGLMSDIREYSEDDRREFFILMLATSSAGLRGSDGVEFVNDFLQAAMDDNSFSLHPKSN